jgi:uncharacterized membrane protein YphA (DoxX/SURF4 family)
MAVRGPGWRGVQPWLGTVARLVVGGVWIVAGALKVGNLTASGRAVAAYRLLPFDAAMFVGAVLPFLEIALGLLLVLGLATRVAAIGSGLLFAVYIVAIASVWIRGLRIDCGCFGTGGDLTGDQRPQYAVETIRDIALLLVAGFLAVFPRTRLSLDARLLDGGVTA